MALSLALQSDHITVSTRSIGLRRGIHSRRYRALDIYIYSRAGGGVAYAVRFLLPLGCRSASSDGLDESAPCRSETTSCEDLSGVVDPVEVVVSLLLVDNVDVSAGSPAGGGSECMAVSIVVCITSPCWTDNPWC